MKGCKKKITLLTAALCLFSHSTFAVDAAPGNFLPGSVEPGVLGRTLSTPPIQAPSVEKPVPVKEEEKKTSALGPEAAKIKFQLNDVIIEGNNIFSDAELRKLYQTKLHTTISIVELEGIVQSISNYYRNKGYVLSRAILPPQHVANGIVHVRVLEGYLADVTVQGDPKRSVYIVQAYGDQIAKSKPLQIKIMEYYLRLANEIPGLSARAVLEPSKTETAASDLAIVATQKTFGAFLSYDNYGTRYIGPNQVTANITGNSVFQPGDSNRITMVRTSRPQQLKYIDIGHDFYLGNHGLKATIEGNSSQTLPGLNLEPLKINGDAVNIFGLLQYPYIRSREADLTLLGGFNYIDSGTDAFDISLYNDHIRPVKFGFLFNFADKYKGTNSFTGQIEQGLNILGASNNPNSVKVSRFGADGIYTKLNATIGRLQEIYGPFSAFIYGTGQYSFNPLLATPQFAFGGSQLGRGYDPAEIIGDRGAAGSLELRANVTPGWKFLQSLQFYGFYDAGVIWNIKRVIGVDIKQSATSTGGGVRLLLNQYISGNLMLAKPLTKQDTAEALVGDGKRLRGFFSIVGVI